MRMTVAADGSIEKAKIFKSSQDPALDAAALDAATRSKYLPATHNCVPFAAEVLYRVNFDRTDVTPAFVPPRGWNAGSDLLSWNRGSDTLAISWQSAYQSLDQQMATRTQMSASTTFLKTERERLCGGKLDAYQFIARGKTGAISEIVFTVSGHLTCQAAYYSASGKMPDRAIEQSLLTLCPVRPS